MAEPSLPFRHPSQTQVHSQFNEDGLVRQSLDLIGETNRYVVDVGAGDGCDISNSKLLRESGWSALLVEADGTKVALIDATPAPGATVAVVHEMATHKNLESIMDANRVPLSPDVMSVDIDGLEFWLWVAMIRRPRVLVIEFNPYAPQALRRNVPALSLFGPWIGDDQTGAGPMMDLGETKGYAFAGSTLCNHVWISTESLND